MGPTRSSTWESTWVRSCRRWCAGPLGERIGWGYGFGAAAVGMILGLLTFVFTQQWLQGKGLPPLREETPNARLSIRDWIDIAVIAAGIAALVFAAHSSLAIHRLDLVARPG